MVCLSKPFCCSYSLSKSGERLHQIKIKEAESTLKRVSCVKPYQKVVKIISEKVEISAYINVILKSYIFKPEQQQRVS